MCSRERKVGGLSHGSKMHVRLGGTQLVTASEGKALVNGMRTERVCAPQTEVTPLQPAPRSPFANEEDSEGLWKGGPLRKGPS